MTDIDRLAGAIMIDPDDDLARLAYADANEEAGAVAEATFVRACMALAGCGLKRCVENPPAGRSTCLECEWCLAWRASVRSSRLTAANFTPCQLLPYPELELFPGNELGYWRGFAEVWAVADVPTFERQAAVAFAHHPITRVALGCETSPSIHLRTILEDYDRDDVHDPLLFDALKEATVDKGTVGPSYIHFGDADLARDTLERACVAYGRGLVGLPRLTEESYTQERRGA